MLRICVFRTLPLLLLAGAFGCNPFDPPVAPPPPDPPTVGRDSKMNLIRVFAHAHENRDILEYAECLHTRYQFWFWEEDDNVFPNPWIERSLDIEITTNMFNSEEVSSIRVDFLNLTDIPGAETDEDRFNLILLPTEGGRVDSVYWGDFSVDMHVLDDNGEEVIDHWVNGRADVYVARDPQFPDLWAIWQIKDRGNEHKSAGSITWGRLKQEF